MRVPNSGIIDVGNGQYRYLTERECLRLMGFDDSDIDKLEEVHPRRKNCTSSKLYKQAGNSIVVDILMAILKLVLKSNQVPNIDFLSLECYDTNVRINYAGGIEMKKANIINLIKYYAENNDSGFRNEAYQIANEFDKMGDYQLSEYVMALLSNTNTFVPQINENELTFVKKIEVSGSPLPLPEEIKSDIIGIINAVGHGIGINKFLFQGAPGTGKTESVKHIARILNRELFVVNFDFIIDSKLGQTGKNISKLFDEINNLVSPEKVVILFDEIDALALDRIDSKDIREMGRATTSVLKGLEELNKNILLIATTNLYDHFDKALVRRFDSVIDFNRYSREDLLEISEIILNYYLPKFENAGRNIRLLKKIVSSVDTIPYPGDLKNIIKTSLAFSNPNEEYDYLKRLYVTISDDKDMDLKTLKTKGFTVREIEILTGISKSQVSRELKE